MPHVATESSNSALAFVLAGGCTLEASKKFKVTYRSLWRQVSRARKRAGSKMHEKDPKIQKRAGNTGGGGALGKCRRTFTQVESVWVADTEKQ